MIRYCFFIFLTFLSFLSYSQAPDTSVNVSPQLPGKYYSKVDKKITSINDQLTKKSLKYLAKFQRQEKRLQQKMQKLNPGLVINNADGKYNEFAQKIKSKTAVGTKIISGEYNPNLDSLSTSLSFLKQFNGISDKVNNPLKSLNLLQGNLQESEKIKAFIAERKSEVKEMLSKYTNIPGGLKNEYAKLNKTAFYYSAQVNQYKEMLKDPQKIEQQALNILNKLPAFQKFMKENSQLGNLFGVPANYGTSQSLQGLQTLEQVRQMVMNKISSGSGASQMLQKQVQAAQGELGKLKDKLDKLGGGSADIEMPDFRANGQKLRSFLKRLEFGTDLQTTRGTYNFPTTTDVGLSVGYRLDTKSTAGIGVSYKEGWGTDIRHIHVTSQGVSLRSFFEYKLKKNFYATGGLEYNYQQPFNSIQQLREKNSWQQSGLIGISKTIEVKSKVFKKTKLQLLWDVLSYQQPIRTEPLKFRVGYDFK